MPTQIKPKKTKFSKPVIQPKKSISVQLLKKDLLLGFFLFVVMLAAYKPAWNGKPIWDDDAHITRPELRSIGGLSHIWTQPGATAQYYPLIHSVFWLEYHLWGDSPLGYHIVNILLHFLSSLLLLCILRLLAIPGAWFIAAIFALHPIQVESVAWINELKNTLSGVFFMSTIFAYLKFDQVRKRIFYAIALCLFILGLLSKSVIATAPLSLLAVFWWKRGKLNWKQDIEPLIPFFIVGIASGLFTAWVERKFVGAEGSIYAFTLIERCLIAGRVVWFYLSKIFWPFNLIFIYPRWNVNQAVLWQYVFPAATLALGGTFWALRNRWRAPFTVFICFTATIFPVMGFFNVYPFCYSFVADHFQYLACIGPIAMAVAGMRLAFYLVKKGRRLLKLAVTIFVFTTLFILTWKQSELYTDAETLYNTTIMKNPGCWMAYNNLGALRMQNGHTDEAIIKYQKSLEINPDNSEARNNLGSALMQEGRIEEAQAQYLKALEINPNFIEAHNNLGVLLARSNRITEAISHFQKVIVINPDQSDAHYNLGNALLQTGQPNEAIIHFRKALEINPNYSEAHNNLGYLLLQTGRQDEAIAHYRKVLELKPGNADAYYSLGKALFQIGQIDEAIACFKSALEINPDNTNTLQNLGYALIQKGQLTVAITYLQKALALAKAAGNESDVKIIAANLEKLNQANH